MGLISITLKPYITVLFPQVFLGKTDQGPIEFTVIYCIHDTCCQNVVNKIVNIVSVAQIYEGRIFKQGICNTIY